METRFDAGSSGGVPVHCQVCGGADVGLFCTAIDRVLMQRSPLWRIERCRACGFGWTSPALPVDRIASFYPPAYLGDTTCALDEFFSGKLMHSRSWRGEVEKTRIVQSCLPGGRILDVGCGDGKFLWALDPHRWDRTGVELSGETVALVRSRMPSLRLLAGDLFSVHLAEESFDALTFWHVFEHLPDPARHLNRASRLLKPGGWLFISLPRLDSLQAHIFRAYWYAFDDVPRHLYHFSRRALDQLLEAAALRIRHHLFFSRLVNFHSLKHSLLNWSTDTCGSRIPYYLLKPLLFAFPYLEQISGRYGILTTIAQKPCA